MRKLTLFLCLFVLSVMGFAQTDKQIPDFSEVLDKSTNFIKENLWIGETPLSASQLEQFRTVNAEFYQKVWEYHLQRVEATQNNQIQIYKVEDTPRHFRREKVKEILGEKIFNSYLKHERMLVNEEKPFFEKVLKK